MQKENENNYIIKKGDTPFEFARHVLDTQYPSSVEGCLQVSDFI